MKEQIRLSFLLIFSILFHAGLLYLVPTIQLPPLEKEEIYEVKLIKPKPVKPAAAKQKVSDNTKTVSEAVKEKPIKKKVIDYAGMKQPDMALPTITTDETINIPDVDLDEKELANNAPEQVEPVTDVNKELTSAEKSFDQYNEDVSKKGIESAEYGESSFYSIKNLSANKRALASNPKTPRFSLENDTKIILQFKVDRYGNPSNIVYITRSDSRIEKIASDFVNGIKFNAVNYETSDTVEITLYFKVK